VRRVGRGEAEVPELALAIAAHPTQPGRARPVLGLRERLRIKNRELQLAAGYVAILLEKSANTPEVARIARRRLTELLRKVQPCRDRLVDAVKDFAGSVGDREEPVLSQVALPVAQHHRRNEVDGQE